MAKKVAFFGGAFNPPHIGHLTTILHVTELTDVERVIVAPVYAHPEGKVIVSFEDRVAMLRLALASQPPHVALDMVEEENWQRGGRGLTISSLNILLARGHEKVLLVLGSDLQESFPKWEGYDDIQALVAAGKVDIYWVERTGTTSSTAARMAIKYHWNTKRVLQPAVRAYIDEKGLYR